MSGSSNVTVPGNNEGSPVTVAFGTGDVLQLAAQIGYLLSTVAGAGNLNVSLGTVGSLPAAPTVGSGTVTELLITGGAGSATVPSGYTYAVDNSALPTTITGSDLTLIAGTSGGAFYVTGTSTVATEGGNNLIVANGTYLVSTGPGNDTISATGVGTIADNAGSNVIFVSDTNSVSSVGQDTVVAGVGITTVNSSGANSLILGSAASGALLYAAVSGPQATVGSFDSDASLTISGSHDLVYGAQALSVITVTGASATLVGGSGAETVGTSSNTLMFGGSGAINFVGGAGTATLVGSAGGTEKVTVGAGGILVSAGADNSSTITSGAGVTTIFGGSNSVVNFVGSQNGAVFVGFTGNETLNAAGSSTSNLFSAGVGSNVSLVGGSGSDTMFAGSGSDTMGGGAGSNAFAFFAVATGGGHDYITDFGPDDALFLVGYASTGSASSLQNAAVVNSSGVTLTLSDSTKITFTNLTSASSLNGEILYVPKVV